MQLIKILAVKNLLGEGIVWHPDQQSLWWTDILTCKLYCYEWQHNNLIHYALPERLGCFGFTKDSQQIIAAFASGIALYNLNTSEVKWLARPELYNKGNRFNDGGVDRLGRFWAGTMVENKQLSTAEGKLYYLKSNGECCVALDNIGISNALCWSTNGEGVYHADSPSHSIFKYQFDNDKGLVNKQLFAETASGQVPDGACIDSIGHLWSAQWGGAQVIEYDIHGCAQQVIQLPVSQPTCVAIGGPNLDLLCITSAQQGLSKYELAKQPQAGNVFIYQLEESLGVNEVFLNTSGYSAI
ncbi:SMP-30/gluconolactonase/LRE family protein [Thalassotalea sp. M1531]|uniref:SMP-30/gluconolactonase/LRE family protein n=1 Tax=Thalassotalea algicola TaxID=2716224 RepID=A0A7Y0L979_9GAMM|nr:SMP-30/gluconolactonase/LRE family protein [Thalassotalea algicola]NMP30176.1 SMP-30/gluconolactonase/LRE family protein [Thalassotalea algicola]